MAEWTEDRKARLIGTLFHDIGKFQYRAEKTTVKHEENSANFISEYLRKHTCLNACLEKAVHIAATHHHDAGDYAARMADHQAARERQEEEVEEARRPLYSVFNHISGIREGVPNNSTKYYFKPGPISATDIFPEVLSPEIEGDEKILRDLHKPHWQGFIQDIKAIPEHLNFVPLFNTLLAVMEKWTSRVSSAGYKTLPDISLYDHSRVTAAYADCLAESKDSEKPFLVIEADISGIQSFIYRIANISGDDQKGTAKTLRGRSFLISIYTDAVSAYLLRELNLLNVHLLLNGGGGFTIIAPNEPAIVQKLPELRKRINRWLTQQFEGEIALILAWQAFSAAEIRQFNRVKRQMLTLIGDEKYHKNIDQVAEPEFWQATAFEDANTRACNQCGIYYVPGRQGDEKRCSSCRRHEQIGKILPHTQTLVLVHDGNIKYVIEGCQSLPIPALQQTWILVKEAWEKQTHYDLLRQILKQTPKATAVDIIRLNKPDFSEQRFIELLKEAPPATSLQFRFLGNSAPKNEEGEVMSFEELAKTSEGYPMLGVLRMDVDSLGAIFGYGFKEEHQTISRIATLSRLLALFFNGYLNHLAEKNKVYITYSGGDDLFVVGGWTGVLEFARAVQADFQKFVSFNPHLSISGGMVIVWPTFPIRFAAEAAKIEEENAKKLDHGKSMEKNAFSLWEEAHHWDKIEEMVEWANKIVTLINALKEKGEKIALRSLIRYFKQLRQESFDANGQQDPSWISKAMHKVHYALKRRAKLGAEDFQKKAPDPLAAALGRVIQEPEFLKDIRLPADYVLLKTRERKD